MNPNTAKKRESAPAQATRPVPNFDTLKVSESLKKAEFGEKQAVTLVEIIQDAQAELATKVDLDALRGDMEKMGLALRGDMEKMETGIRHDMGKMETGIRHDMGKMEAGIRRDMEKMETGIRHDMEKMETGIRRDMGKMETGIRRDMEAGFHGLEKMVLNLRVDTEAGFRRVEAGSQRIAWLLTSAIVAATGVISMVILYGGA